jgi:hypothetical protein
MEDKVVTGKTYDGMRSISELESQLAHAKSRIEELEGRLEEAISVPAPSKSIQKRVNIQSGGECIVVRERDYLWLLAMAAKDHSDVERYNRLKGLVITG